jgi:hypothetical protein
MRQLRLWPALAACVFLLAAAQAAPATTSTRPLVTGYVDVDFAGSAAFERSGSTVETYGWSEHALLPLADGTFVPHGGLDEVTGSGSITDGDCVAEYTSASSTVGTRYGIRAHSLGPDGVEIAGLGPFPLLHAVPHACPGGRIARVLSGSAAGTFGHVFRCVLRQLGWCRQDFSIPANPVARGTIVARATFYAQYIQREDLSSSKMLSSYLGLLVPQLKLWSLRPAPTRHRMPVVVIAPPADGAVSIAASVGTSALATVSGTAHVGARPTLVVTWNRSGLAAAAKLRRPAPVTIRATFTPTSGKPLTVTRTAYVA